MLKQHDIREGETNFGLLQVEGLREPGVVPDIDRYVQPDDLRIQIHDLTPDVYASAETTP